MQATTAIRWMTLGLTVLLVATVAPADWDPGDSDKMHYPQLPDLENGFDVLDGPYNNPISGSGIKILADDWKCSESGPVTDIHVWSSYLNDLRPVPGPNTMFNVAIYDDIPAGDSSTGYSMPGNLLWNVYVRPTAERVYAGDITEAFYDPNLGQVIGDDQTCWQYNFLFDEANAFPQEEGKIYWLSVSHTADLNGDGIVMFDDLMLPAVGWAYGWKTTDRRWNDTAVWIDAIMAGPFPQDAVPPSGSDWNMLARPQGDLMVPMDLAFVITPDPATLSLLGLGAVGLVTRRRRK